LFCLLRLLYFAFDGHTMAFFFFLVGLYAFMSPSLLLADKSALRPTDDAAAIIEANRLLEEELKLAARPHIYMVLDPTAHVIFIKSRGVELHRLHIIGFRQIGEGSLNGVFRLRARPSVTRPKAAPADTVSVPAIDLQTMPDRYDLMFDPGLIISVGQTARERPWPWMKGLAYEWWSHLADMLGITIKADDAAAVRIHLVVAQETARSLAWIVTDGMPLIIGRTASPYE
jgi:hypothetical protein